MQFLWSQEHVNAVKESCDQSYQLQLWNPTGHAQPSNTCDKLSEKFIGWWFTLFEWMSVGSREVLEPSVVIRHAPLQGNSSLVLCLTTSVFHSQFLCIFRLITTATVEVAMIDTSYWFLVFSQAQILVKGITGSKYCWRNPVISQNQQNREPIRQFIITSRPHFYFP